MRNNKSKIMNDNSNIFALCKCDSRFHKYFHTDRKTLRTFIEVTSTRRLKQHKRSRFSFDDIELNSPSSKILNLKNMRASHLNKSPSRASVSSMSPETDGNSEPEITSTRKALQE